MTKPIINSILAAYGELRRYLAHRLGNPDDAADATHDAVIRVLETTGTAIVQPRAYFRRTAFNAATDTYRRRVAHEMVPFDAVPEPAAASDDPEAMLRASRFLWRWMPRWRVAAKMPAGVHLATARWVDSGRDRGAHGPLKKYDREVYDPRHAAFTGTLVGIRFGLIQVLFDSFRLIKNVISTDHSTMSRHQKPDHDPRAEAACWFARAQSGELDAEQQTALKHGGEPK